MARRKQHSRVSPPNKEVGTLLKKARRLAMEYVEQKARKILREHPNLKEFVMGMGTCLFSTTINGRHANLGLEERAYFRTLLNFINAWDDSLGILGEPMRFTVDRPVVRSW